MLQDRTLNCRDCGNDFVFSVSEQEFFAEKGFDNDPARCPQCRAARKERNRQNSRHRPGYNRERRMYPAVCATCGQETEVPFKPVNDKPVYCRDCFKQRANKY